MAGCLKNAVMVISMAGVLAGCAGTQVLERDMEMMKSRLADLERASASPARDRMSEMTQRLDTLAKGQADLQANLDSLRVETQSMQGRFDDVGHRLSGAKEEQSLLKDDLRLKIKALEERLSKFEHQALSAAPAAPAASAPVAPAATGGEAAPAVHATADPAEALYQKGLDLVQKKGDMAQGREAFGSFMKTYPQHALAVNAMYWIGETYYGEKKYENAILQFQDVIQKYGDHPKVASALFKQGLSFHALGDVKEAKVILQRLVKSFPLSEEAARAKEKLAAWGK